MKKIILLPFLLLSLLVLSQPKIVGTLSNSGAKQGGALYRLDLPGTTPGTNHVFDNFAPHYSIKGVVTGDADWLYGCLQFNGTDNSACLYRIKQDGSGFTKLVDFNNNSFITSKPYFHTDGKIYVSTGVIIKVYDPSNGSSTNITYNGSSVNKSIYIDASDFIYFTRFDNTLIKIKTDGTQETDLHAFDGATEGTNGQTAVIETPGDTLFGTRTSGGINDAGTLYSIKKDGTGFIVHHQFITATGSFPESKLVLFDGKLYGTTTQGGDFNNGVIFVINADGTNYRKLYSFPQVVGGGTPANDIAISSDGRIFGSYLQFYQDLAGFGQPFRLYKIDTSGSGITPFFLLDQHEGGHFNQDILLLNDQTIITTTQEMGRHDGGSLITIDSAGFSGTSLFNFGFSANGFYPTAGLIKATDGKLYGTTRIGGATGNGTIFSSNADGTGYTKLHEFNDADGYNPWGKLLEASDGKLYGALNIGGPANSGGIYRVNKNGTSFEVVFRFPDWANQGLWPVGGLVEDAGGFLYGIASNGGTGGNGTIFKLNRDGSNYTVLKPFGIGDFRFSIDGLVLSNGYLYGSTPSGGSLSQGGYFRIKTDGTDYSVLHDFTDVANGQEPRGAPMIASNGKLYGTTARGGANNDGIIFNMDITGSNFTILRSLSFTTDGSYPQARLIQGSDGLVYGTTFSSNITLGNNGGTVFKMNLDGSGFAVIKEFNTSTEGQSTAAIIDLNGAFNLPVRWLTFTAQSKEQVVQLFWQTAQEQNTDRFIVERSTDGIIYQSIGSLKAAGNANNTSTYRFTDNDPQYGNNYYRLKQTDMDGKFTYSSIARVNFNGSPVITMHPNPTSDNLYVKAGTTETIRSVIVSDINGRVIMRAGGNNRSSMILYVKQLESGVYWLQVETNQQKHSLKFIKK